jgi:hypothetical protein
VNAAVAEALADPRVGQPAEVEAAAELARWDVPDGELVAVREERAIEWATQTLTQAEILAAFGRYCREELDDVEVVDESPTRLSLAWRRERNTVELRAAFLFADRLAADGPALLLGPIGPKTVERFLEDEPLRARVGVLDLARLEKIVALRSSIFVYFEWFLRDEYGVKVVPEQSFTTGLVERGIISLGMG